MILTKEQTKRLEKASEPLIKFLNNVEIFHPHVSVIVDNSSAVLVENVVKIINEKYLVD